MQTLQPQPNFSPASFSIVIPSFNRADVIERTLRQLAGQDYPPDQYELIVVDDSTDETPAIVRRFAKEAPFKVRLIDDCRCIPAIKRNVGLAVATGDYVLFMNDDVWAEPELLQEHARSHAAHGEPIAVLGRVEQSSEMPPTAFLEWYHPFAYHLLAQHADRAVPYAFCWSMNLSLPRERMLAEGLTFHEEWSQIGHEDVELGYRWTSAGHPVIYNPRALCYHYHLHTLASACRLQESIGKGLRDLERLIADPTLRERYGVFSWRNSPRAVVRGLIRQALVNDLTGPLLERWLGSRTTNTLLTRWLYWKVMLRHTQRGYRGAGRQALAAEPLAAPRDASTKSVSAGVR
jgi:hypothetical protein